MNEQELRELTEEYGRGFDLLSAAVAQVPPQAWDFKPAADEWSVRQLIAHMADSETIGATRLYMIVAQPGSTLMSYEDAAWGRVLGYPERSTEQALQLFRLLRQTIYSLLNTLPEAALSNSVIHPDRPYPEYGEAYTVEKWLRIYTRHVRDHIEQLRAIHRTWKEQQG
jgi:hypothetical protein